MSTKLFGLDDFSLDVFKKFVIQIELPLERSIRDPSFTLEKSNHLV
jgi:hypothetical protein